MRPPPIFEFLTRPLPPPWADVPQREGGMSAEIVLYKSNLVRMRQRFAEISLKNRQNAKIPH